MTHDTAELHRKILGLKAALTRSSVGTFALIRYINAVHEGDEEAMEEALQEIIDTQERVSDIIEQIGE